MCDSKKAKPCETCDVAVLESMMFDEVTCHKHCEKFKAWRCVEHTRATP